MGAQHPMGMRMKNGLNGSEKREPMGTNGFRAAGFPWRLYCGRGVLEESLKDAVMRTGARRAFVVCSPSITRRTDSVARIARALGDLYAGVFDAVENDATYASVRAAKEAAVAAGADLLVAVGGGSVIMAARGVAIFMAEPGDPFEIMTQYPEGRPAFSPRLTAAKPPIINVPTTPNSAMNRAGTALKNPDLDHRMEYFDPKTRPHSIFLDEEALLATPPELIRSTATTIFAGLIAVKGQIQSNPLVAGDDEQAFRLTYRAYQRLPDEPGNASLLIDLGIAAFLRNRAEDDGMGRLLRAALSPAIMRSRRRSISAIRASARVNRRRPFTARESGSPRRSTYGWRGRSPRLSKSGVTAWKAAKRSSRWPTGSSSSIRARGCRRACASSISRARIFRSSRPTP
jgi:hypothetical protein